MRLIEIGLPRVDTTVGAFDSNVAKILSEGIRLGKAGVTLVLFPEMTICGYPAEDLVQWQGFTEESWQKLRHIAATLKSYSTVYAVGLPVRHEGHIYNAAAVIYGGKILGIVPKEKLPTYGVFYDDRTFSPGYPGMSEMIEGIPFGDLIFTFPFGTISFTICEDDWTPDGPMARRAKSGSELNGNLSASPFRSGVVATRREMMAQRSADNLITALYCSQVGGMDGLVFDGDALVYQNGRALFAETKRWQERTEVVTVDLDAVSLARAMNTTWGKDHTEFKRTAQNVPAIVVPKGPKANQAHFMLPAPANKSYFLPNEQQAKDPTAAYFDDLIEAMIMGLSGFYGKNEKNGVYKRITLAVSGGRDSVLALLIIALYAQRKFAHLSSPKKEEAIEDFIWCFSMPTRHNSEGTKSVAHDVCTALGVRFKEISIEDAFNREVDAARLMYGEEPRPVTKQNIQARLRALREWGVSNDAQALLINTSNMSEGGAGFGTLGGDYNCGLYALLGNLPKSVINVLIVYLNDVYFNIPAINRMLAMEISAELDAGQRDEDELGPYKIFDSIITLFVGERRMPHEVYTILRAQWSDEDITTLYPKYTSGMLKYWVKRNYSLLYNSPFKWVMKPLAVHVGAIDLDRERALQIPVVKSMEWLIESFSKIDALPD